MAHSCTTLSHLLAGIDLTRVLVVHRGDQIFDAAARRIRSNLRLRRLVPHTPEPTTVLGALGESRARGD